MFSTGNLKPQVNFTECQLTPQEKTNFDALKTILLRDHPFFSFIMLEKLKLVFTRDIPTAATDGVRFIYMNPDYIGKLLMKHQVYAFLHEIAHCIYEHLPRSKAYEIVQNIGGVKFDYDRANIAQDARINFDLSASLDASKAAIHKDWIYDASVKPDETWEALYVRYFQHKPPPPPSGGSGRQGKAPQNPSGQNPWNGASFDVHLPPPIDPATGQPVQPDTQGMKEAVVQAAGFAKNQGKMPAGFQKFIDELLNPKVPWEDHLKNAIARVLGGDETSWKRLHRRKLGVSYKGFQGIYPGKLGHSPGGVIGALDTSGSMWGGKEMTAGVTEFAAILEDHRPAWFKAMWCDAKVHRVDENIESAADLMDAIAKGIPGGGGTDFRPVFDTIAEAGLDPTCVVFFTDGYGSFPDEAPPYDVIWVMTTDVKPPFGDFVKVEV